MTQKPSELKHCPISSLKTHDWKHIRSTIVCMDNSQRGKHHMEKYSHLLVIKGMNIKNEMPLFTSKLTQVMEKENVAELKGKHLIYHWGRSNLVSNLLIYIKNKSAHSFCQYFLPFKLSYKKIIFSQNKPSCANAFTIQSIYNRNTMTFLQQRRGQVALASHQVVGLGLGFVAHPFGEKICSH